MELGLEGSGVLVTGAAGGIGAATARALAAEGARVAVHYHSSRQAAEALAAQIGGVPLQADLRDEAAADALVPAAVEALGRLDACVANAGTWDPEDVPVARMSLERWRSTVDSNLTATFLTARSYLRHVEATQAGSLVLVASTSGLFGEAGHADYSAAKAGMAHGLALSLKNEIVRSGAARARQRRGPGLDRDADDRGGAERGGDRARDRHDGAAQGRDRRGRRARHRVPVLAAGGRPRDRPDDHGGGRDGGPASAPSRCVVSL